MIEDSAIVKDTRRIRKSISEEFNHDIDRYLDYLYSKESDESSDAGGCFAFPEHPSDCLKEKRD